MCVTKKTAAGFVKNKTCKYLGLLLTLMFVFLLNSTLVFADGFKPSTSVTTQYGEVEGYVDPYDTLVWKGIPYAKPPVGDLRWQPPDDPEPWESLKAIEDCEPCTQFAGQNETGGDILIGSEDCLYLNIFRPNTNKPNLPVYFWIHGGSNSFGSAEIYNATGLAQRENMVVVVIQYRLGPLGWLSHPAMRHGLDAHADSGNFGTLDTLKALEWVEDNIECFGGNPDNVTIAGESAGAHNVMNLVVSQQAAGLFHKAISMSGGMKTTTQEAGDAWTDKTIEYLLAMNGLSEVPDGDVEGYLRAQTLEDLLTARKASGGFIFSHPAYQDGVVIPIGGVVPAIESGRYNQVPIILGGNEDEMKYFLRYFGSLKGIYMDPSSGITEPIPSGDFTWADVNNIFFGNLSLDDVFPTDEDKALYQACAEFGSLNWRYNFVDMIARPLREHQNKVYTYDYKWAGEEGSAYNFVFGAAHGTELSFFFGWPIDILGGIAFNPYNDTIGRQSLSVAMMDYVGKFARSGNPNGNGQPVWKQWCNRPDKPKAIVFDADEYHTDIHMMTEEITVEDVDAKFWELYDALPESTQNALFIFDWY